MTDNPQDLFPQAAQDFDLEKIRQALNEVHVAKNQTSISETAWRYFVGRICGLSDAEVANICVVTEGTVKNELSRSLSSSVTEWLKLKRCRYDRVRAILLKEYGNSPKQGMSLNLDWEEVVRAQWQKQQENFRNRSDFFASSRKSPVYVPLGLVQPDVEQSSRSSKHRQRGSQEQVEKQFEHDAFLSEVAIKGERSLVIVGEPGAGKSTWLEQIGSFLLNKENTYCPIFISLYRLQPGQMLGDYLQETWLDEALQALQLQDLELTDEIVREFKEQIRQGRFCLLLDGLDEISGEVKDIANSLQGFLKNTRVFLSCRLNVWETFGKQLFSGFDVFRTLDFSQEQIEEFILQWRKGDCQAQSLIDVLQEEQGSRLLDLVKNPLRLVMLCQIWYENQTLPQTRADLYSRFVRLIYSREKYSISEHVEHQLNFALGELAKAMIDQNRPLDGEFVAKSLGENLELAKRLGWLNQIGISKGQKQYAFYHLAFAEYFAACSIENFNFFLPESHEDHPIDNQKYRFLEKEWQEVILFWIGLDKISEDEKYKFLKKVLDFQDGIEFRFYKNKAFLVLLDLLKELNTQKLKLDIVPQLSEIIEDKFWGRPNSSSWDNSCSNYYIELTKKLRNSQIKISEKDKLHVSTLANSLIKSQDFYTLRDIKYLLKEDEYIIEKIIKDITQKLEKSQEFLQEIELLISIVPKNNQETISLLVSLLESQDDEIIVRHNIIRYLHKLSNFDDLNITSILINYLPKAKLHAHLDCSDFITNPSIDEIALALIERNHNSKTISEIIKIATFETTEAESLEDIFLPFEATKILSKLISSKTIKFQDQYDDIKTIIDKNINVLSSILDDQDEKEKFPSIFLYMAKLFGIIDPDNRLVISAIIDFIKKAGVKPVEYQPNPDIKISKGEVNFKNKEELLNVINASKEAQIKYRKVSALSELLGKIAINDKEALQVISQYPPDWEKMIIEENVFFESIDLSVQEQIKKAFIGGLSEKDVFKNIVNILQKRIRRDSSIIIDSRLFKIALKSFEKMYVNNPNFAQYIEDYLENYNDLHLNIILCKLWSHLEINNSRGIEYLENILDKSEDCQICILGALALDFISPNNKKSLQKLINIVLQSSDMRVVKDSTYHVIKILRTHDNCISILNLFKGYLKNQETINRDNSLFKNCVDILWHCSKILSYPEFYIEWHKSLTSHPESLENDLKPIAFISQNLVEYFPQPERRKLYFIELDRTLDPENPALDYYDQLESQNFPHARDNPDTMQKLKLHWNQVQRSQSDKDFLILYCRQENPRISDQQLDKFSHFEGYIAAITYIKSKTIQTFNPKDRKLLDNVKKWIDRIQAEI